MLSVFRYCLIYLKMTAGDQRLARAELFIMQILVRCAVVCIVYVVGLGVLVLYVSMAVSWPGLSG